MNNNSDTTVWKKLGHNRRWVNGGDEKLKAGPEDRPNERAYVKGITDARWPTAGISKSDSEWPGVTWKLDLLWQLRRQEWRVPGKHSDPANCDGDWQRAPLKVDGALEQQQRLVRYILPLTSSRRARPPRGCDSGSWVFFSTADEIHISMLLLRCTRWDCPQFRVRRSILISLKATEGFMTISRTISVVFKLDMFGKDICLRFP